jgi:hypothetical protein
MSKNEGIGTVIDIYGLRAAFGRRARYDDRATVKQLLHTARQFENMLTHYYHEHPGLPENKVVLQRAEAKLKDMAELAFAMKAAAIVVPVPAESHDVKLVGAMARRMNLPVQILFPAR